MSLPHRFETLTFFHINNIKKKAQSTPFLTPKIKRKPDSSKKHRLCHHLLLQLCFGSGETLLVFKDKAYCLHL